MIVKMFNLPYFIYFAAAIILTIVAVKFLKNKSEKYRFWFIYGLILLNLFIHFAKIFIYPYTTVENIWTKVSFENICAVSALLFPILYFAKNKTLRDYMVMVGVTSGIITFIYPIDAMSDMFNAVFIGVKPAFSLEVIRFYTSHFLIFLSPFLMLHFKIHELSIKRAHRAPFMLLSILIIIFLNEVVVTLFRWVPAEELFDPTKRNPSFIFGFGGRTDLSGIGMILGIFVPSFLRVNPFFNPGPLFVGQAYFPVLWLLFPTLVYGSLIALTYMIIYDREETLKFFKLKKAPLISQKEEKLL